jgi:hypothetical protein
MGLRQWQIMVTEGGGLGILEDKSVNARLQHINLK